MCNHEFDLLNLRRDIDRTDKSIAKLLKKRLIIAKKIMIIKKKKKLLIIDEKRELEILNYYCSFLKNFSTRKKIIDLGRALIALSPNYPAIESSSLSKQNR